MKPTVQALQKDIEQYISTLGIHNTPTVTLREKTEFNFEPEADHDEFFPEPLYQIFIPLDPASTIATAQITEIAIRHGFGCRAHHNGVLLLEIEKPARSIAISIFQAWEGSSGRDAQEYINTDTSPHLAEALKIFLRLVKFTTANEATDEERSDRAKHIVNRINQELHCDLTATDAETNDLISFIP